MAITLQCPKSGCSASSVIADSFSGRKVRCKKCNTPFVVQPTFDGQKSDTRKSHPLANANPFPQLPAEFGRYRVLKLLGRGGMGAVYLADDTQLGRQVALKIPFFDSKESPQRIERFAREARSAAILAHPNICRVFDSGQIDGRNFITMELIEGSPLETVIGRGPIAEPSAAEIAFQVAEALGYAHGKGTVHRDLKPANIMITEGGEAIVMDFGLAKQLLDVDPNEAKLSRDGGLLGTPSYMSPEQVKGDVAAIGPATDIYSLGVVLFEMLTGSTPYTGAMGAVLGQILGAPIPPLSEFKADADPRLEVICRKAMAKNPADRFPSMAKFANALGKYLQEPGAAPASKPKPAPAVAPVPTPFAAPVYHAPAPIPAPQRILAPQLMPTPVEAFDDLHDEEELEPTSKKTSRKKKSRLPVYLGLAVALAILLPLGIWLGVTLLRVETPNGTLVVEIDDPEVEAKIKDGKLILSGPDGKTRYTLSPGERDKKIDAGQYKVRVEGTDGLLLDTPEFTLKKGNKVTVRVTMDKKEVAKKDALRIKTYCCDMEEFNWRGLGDFLKQGKGFDGLLKVDGDLVPHGILMHPQNDSYARVRYKLAGSDAYSFQSTVAIADSSNGGSATPLTFQVYGDGNFLWESKPIQKPGAKEDCNVKLNSVDFLELRVLCPGPCNSAQAVWMDARILSAKRAPPPTDEDKTKNYPAPGDADRKAAEYVLSIGGIVRINDEVEDIKTLTALPKESFRLSSADLKDCKLTDSGLAVFKGCRNLTNLSLFSTPVTDAGLVHFKECKKLQLLNLRGTAIRSAGLANFEGCGNLTELMLHDVFNVGDSGLSYFRKCKMLRLLTVSRTQLTDDGLMMFEDCKSLEAIQLFDTKVSVLGAQKLKMKLPKCKIDILPEPAAESALRDGFLPLFNGKDLSGWTAKDGGMAKWEVIDGYLEVAPGEQEIVTEKEYGAHFKLHAEFWLPGLAEKEGPFRANSGIFLQGRYEIQIFDSYMNTKDIAPDQAVGALDGIIAPDPEKLKKAVRKAETWNSIDIDFQAPRTDKDGAVLEAGRLTVELNGIKIIDNAKFDKVTAGAKDQQIGNPGPIRLQNHGHKVRFRNLTIQDLSPKN